MQQDYYNNISKFKKVAFIDNVDDNQAKIISEQYPFAICFTSADPNNQVIWYNGKRYGGVPKIKTDLVTVHNGDSVGLRLTDNNEVELYVEPREGYDNYIIYFIDENSNVLGTTETLGIIPTINGYSLPNFNINEYTPLDNYNPYWCYHDPNDDSNISLYNPGNIFTPEENPTYLYIKYKYQVTYDLNGGSGTTPETQESDMGKPITIANGEGLTKTDYVFNGWIDDNNNNQYAPGNPYNGGNITLHAKWIDDTKVTVNESSSSLITSNYTIDDNSFKQLRFSVNYPCKVIKPTGITDFALSGGDTANTTHTIRFTNPNVIHELSVIPANTITLTFEPSDERFRTVTYTIDHEITLLAGVRTLESIVWTGGSCPAEITSGAEQVEFIRGTVTAHYNYGANEDISVNNVTFTPKINGSTNGAGSISNNEINAPKNLKQDTDVIIYASYGGKTAEETIQYTAKHILIDDLKITDSNNNVINDNGSITIGPNTGDTVELKGIIVPDGTGYTNVNWDILINEDTHNSNSYISRSPQSTVSGNSVTLTRGENTPLSETVTIVATIAGDQDDPNNNHRKTINIIFAEAEPVQEPHEFVLSKDSQTVIRQRGNTIQSFEITGGDIVDDQNTTISQVYVEDTGKIIDPTTLRVYYNNEDGTYDWYTDSALTATYDGNDVNKSAISWTTNNTDIVVIDHDNHKFICINPGSAELTATYLGVSTTFTLNIINVLNYSDISSGWTYTSSNPSVLSINGNTITGESAGGASINIEYGGKTEIFRNILVSSQERTYYWYIGQTDPYTMNNITDITNEFAYNVNDPGWRAIGTTSPTASSYTEENPLYDGVNNPIQFDDNNYIYIAIPYDGLEVYDFEGDPGTVFNEYSNNESNIHEINDIQYYIYKSEGTRRGFAMNIYHKALE